MNATWPTGKSLPGESPAMQSTTVRTDRKSTASTVVASSLTAKNQALATLVSIVVTQMMA